MRYYGSGQLPNLKLPVLRKDTRKPLEKLAATLNKQFIHCTGLLTCAGRKQGLYKSTIKQRSSYTCKNCSSRTYINVHSPSLLLIFVLEKQVH